MKKNLFTVLLTALVFMNSSCGRDDKDNKITPITPDPPVDKVLSPAEQKEYIEKVALEFMNMMPASDFREIADLEEFIRDTYGDDYNWKNVERWAKDAFDASREALGTKTTDTETEKWGNNTYKYNYIYTNYRAVILASNFTGHFKAVNGSWVRENAVVNDLQFTFPDQYDQKCVIKLETSGKVKKVYLYNEDDWQDYDYYSNGNTYTSNDYYDRTQFTIGVPEKIVVTLTQGESKAVTATINFDLSNIVNEEFDLSKSSLTLSALVELNNGYNIKVSKVAYTANTKASVDFSISKNKKPLVTMGVAADVKDIPSVNVSAFSLAGFDADDYDFDQTNAKNAFVKLDIIGKLQIQGTLSDVKKFCDYLNEADNNDNNEKNFKSYINQANGLMNINLFYDDNSTKQAAVKMEPFAEESWGGHTYWETEPVLYFFDGSSYNTFEAFFNEKDFKKTIDTFKKLANKYADLVDERIDW